MASLPDLNSPEPLAHAWRAGAFGLVRTIRGCRMPKPGDALRTGVALVIMAVSFVATVSHAREPDLREAPRFEDFLVDDYFEGVPASPRITSAELEEDALRIRTAVSRGPNFAGHYTVVTWRCGGGLFRFVVVDAETGGVIDPLPNCLHLGSYGADLPERDRVNPQHFRESRLLKVGGAVVSRSGADIGPLLVRYYEMREGRIRLIRELRVEDEQ